MAATAQSNSADLHFKIVDRLDSVPLVHDSVAYAQSLINSTQLTASIYQTALGLATKSYDIASPVIVRTKPILESADGLAVAVVDRAEATFPYPFKTPTEDLVVVKQAKAVYDARLAPLFQNAQPVVQDVINKTAAINSALGARAVATIQSSQEYSHALLEQLRSLAEQGATLPHTLVEGVQKVTHEVKDIVLSKETSIQEKSNKLGAYVIDQVKPVVDEIYQYVLGAKKKVQEETQAAAAQVDEAVSK